MTKHRHYDADFKVRVVLEALEAKKTMAQICREHGIAQDLLSRWRQDFLARAPQLFATTRQGTADQTRIEELERLVGQLTLELAASKKVSQLLPSRTTSGGRS